MVGEVRIQPGFHYLSRDVSNWKLNPSYSRVEYNAELDRIHKQLTTVGGVEDIPGDDEATMKLLYDIVHQKSRSSAGRMAVGTMSGTFGKGIVLVTMMGSLQFYCHMEATTNYWVLKPGANLAVRFAEYDFQPASYHPFYLFSKLNISSVPLHRNLILDKDSVFFEHDVQIRAAMIERVELVLYGETREPVKKPFDEVTEEAFFIVENSQGYEDFLEKCAQHDYVAEWQNHVPALLEMAKMQRLRQMKGLLDDIAKGRFVSNDGANDLMNLVDVYQRLVAMWTPNGPANHQRFQETKLRFDESDDVMVKFQKNK